MTEVNVLPQRSRFESLATGAQHKVRILVDNGSYGMQNHGDVSMLIVAVERLGRLWPNAEILVVTDRPVRLKRAVPRAVPVPTYGHLLGPLHGMLSGVEQKILRSNPTLALLIIKAAAKLFPKFGRNRDLQAYARIIADVDLVVASGGGYMTDDFNFYAMPILDVLETGARLGKVTALLGQGLGPFKEGHPLLDKVQAVLPRMDCVMVRERRASTDLLRQLSVPADRVTLTGDDAIELAYGRRPNVYGDGIGVNMRRTKYAEVDDDILGKTKSVLHEAARRRETSLIPLPISVSNNEGDFRSIRELLAGFDDASDGGAGMRTPQAVIDQVGRCRIVVTGAYHAAVFALSCGIPAVCLANSHYYVDKLTGLADQFGDGCAVVIPSEKNYQATLAESIRDAWDRAEEVRPKLLAAARRQIESGNDAYQRLFEMVEARRGN